MRKNTIEEILKEFANDHNIDLGVLESFTQGVTSRIEKYGVDKFNSLTYAQRVIVINAAVESYFLWAEKYYSDLENNVDGAFDRLLNDVYEVVKKDKH